MKKLFQTILFLLVITTVAAQNNYADSIHKLKIVVHADPRLDILAKKETEFNQLSNKSVKGYRLLVISSNDREKVMKVRAKLLQLYPDQKIYMIFQAPFIKLKFGDFVEKTDAENYRDMISGTNVVSNNIYVVTDVVEVKPDKQKENEEQ